MIDGSEFESEKQKEIDERKKSDKEAEMQEMQKSKEIDARKKSGKEAEMQEVQKKKRRIFKMRIQPQIVQPPQFITNVRY